MTKKELFLSIFIAVLLLTLTGTYLYKKNITPAEKNIIKISKVTEVIQQPLTLEDLTKRSDDKCGYEYFIKKTDGSYAYLPEEIATLKNSNPEPGSIESKHLNDFMSSFMYTIPEQERLAFGQKNKSSYQEDYEKYINSHPQSILSVVLYTKGCKESVNKPSEYYTPKALILKTKAEEDVVSKIYKASTTKEFEQNTLSSGGTIMNCRLVLSINSKGIDHYQMQTSIKEEKLTKEQEAELARLSTSAQEGGMGDDPLYHCKPFGYYDMIMTDILKAPNSFILYQSHLQAVPYWSERVIVN